MRRLGAVALSALLIACGGGGGGGTAPASAGGGSTGSGSGSSSGATALPAVDVSPVVVSSAASALDGAWLHGAVMQVFVRSYQDSDGDGIGDLKGLISRLDYLKDLGIRGLWLMPIHPSQDGDHGYAVTDYRAVNPVYGTLADLDELLRQAHARGIGVVLDYVINHSAAAHPLFANARDGAGNPWRDWYVWQATGPTGWNVFGGNPWRQATTGWYYAPFWDQMPDFNLKNPAVVDWHLSNLRFWLNRGVDGFRFDAVGLLVENGPAAWVDQPESYALMRSVRSALNAYERRMSVCEGADDPSGFAAACGRAFAFGLQNQILAAARGETMAVQTLAQRLRAPAAGLAPFASNHDTFAGQRPWDQLGGDIARLKLVPAHTLLAPGTPFLYYGEEIGLAGAATLTGDPKLRTPMSWTADALRGGFTTGTPYRALSANVSTQNVAAQADDPTSLLQHYRTLLSLRNARPSLQTGVVTWVSAQGAALAHLRTQDAERTLVLVNHGDTALTLTLEGLPANAPLRNLAVTTAADGPGRPVGATRLDTTPAAAGSTDAAGRATLTLAPRSLRVLDAS